MSAQRPFVANFRCTAVGSLVLARISRSIAATFYLSCCASILLAQSSDRDRIRTPPLAIAEILADRHVPDSVLDVHRQAMLMAPADRFEFLADWVLPGNHHDSIRLAIDFAPTHPAPPFALDVPFDRSRQKFAARTGACRVETGGTLISPVLDLVDAATASGLLDQLSDRVTKVRTDSAVQQRAQRAVQVLIEIARSDFSAANKTLDELLPAVGGISAQDPVDRTAATLVAWAALQHPETRETAREFLDSIHASMQHGVRTGAEAWDAHLFMLSGFSRYVHEYQGDSNLFAIAPQLQQWSSVSRPSVRSRGEGWPLAHWQLATEFGASRQSLRVDSLAGHHQDYLYFQSPLRGEFHVECEVTAGAWVEGHLLVAGHWFAPFGNAEFSSGTIRDEVPSQAHPQRRMPAGEWMRYRASVADGVLSVFFDGHQVKEVKLPTHYDPWVAIRSRSHNQSCVRDVRISGSASVPGSIQLATSPELIGWYSYCGETVNRPDAAWRFENDTLIGRRVGTPVLQRDSSPLDATVSPGQNVNIVPIAAPDIGVESLLQYHRPMLEDGAIEYEFFYQPGGQVAHPALDRLVLLLEADGVKIHWLTDGPYDRTDAEALGAKIESDWRRGPAQLPLVADQWNKVTLAATGSTLDLMLNGKLVYERPIETTNQRFFGLFHFADQSEVQVRNVVWRGNWPRNLPRIADQELADLHANAVVTQSLELPVVWEHDFASQGLPAARFQWTPAEGVLQADGLLVVQKGAEQWVQQMISGLVGVNGDFDIAATFDGLSTTLSDPTDEAALLMQIVCAGETDHYHMGRRSFRRENEIVETVHNPLQADGSRKPMARTIPQASSGGTFRIIRQEDRMLFLFAEGKSDQFRLLDEQRAVATDVPLLGIRLLTQARGAKSESRVLWKKLAIRAAAIQSTPLAVPE